jgi:FkbM family methyltransferase
VADKTVLFWPFGGRSFTITGSEQDSGVVGELERSGGQYQSDLAVLLHRLLPSDAVVVDGGAHIGVLTVLMASLAPDGEVHAFEPGPANFAYLVRNLAANCVTNATAQAVALYDRDGETTFHFVETYPAGSYVGDGPGPTVPTVRLDTWARGRGLERLDLLKLDVEGAELAVLDGASKTVRRLRPVVVVECNAVTLHRYGGRSWRDLLARMRRLFPGVGGVVAVAPGGTVVPIAGSRHLELLIGDLGVLDLVGLPDPCHPLRQAEVAERSAAVDLDRLHATYNRWRPPERNFLHDPRGVELSVGPPAVAGRPAEMLAVAVHVTNRSRWWLSSHFAHQPIYLSYRFYDARGGLAVREGHQTAFPQPVGPGQSVELDLTVQLPAAAGHYQLAVTALQEGIAWFDHLVDTCDARIPAEVMG